MDTVKERAVKTAWTQSRREQQDGVDMVKERATRWHGHGQGESSKDSMDMVKERAAKTAWTWSRREQWRQKMLH